MSKWQRYDDNFRKQIVALYNSGKSVMSICAEYKLLPAAVYKWIKQFNQFGSFKALDNRSELENELILARKKLKQLEMENDILKQAALIIGRK